MLTGGPSAPTLGWQRCAAVDASCATGVCCVAGRRPSLLPPTLLHWAAPQREGPASAPTCARPLAGNTPQVLEAAQPTGTSTGGASNPIWLAPEILRGGKATAASDVFSFGCAG